MHAAAVIDMSQDAVKSTNEKDKRASVLLSPKVYEESQDLPHGVRTAVMRNALEVHLELIADGLPEAGEILLDKRKLRAFLELVAKARGI